MRVWIVNQYGTSPETGMGGRHYYLAQGLAKLGHDVTIVAARWHHLLRDSDQAKAAPKVEEKDGFRFARVDVPKYAHAHDKRRILNWLKFSRKLRYLPDTLGETPDVILYSSPSLIGFLGAERLAQKTNARLVFEVRDIWPLTLQEVGGKSPWHPLLMWMQWIEDRAYRVSDAVVSNLPNAAQHMEVRGMVGAKFTWIPNGFSLEEVEAPDPLSSETLAKLPKGKFLVGYTGTIGEANALETLVGAAEHLRKRDDIAFVVVGGGRDKDRLASEISRRGLTNFHLLDPIPKRQVQSMLSAFDACVICWKKTPLYRFGTAANKIPEYLFSARPVINSFTGYGDLIHQYDAGFSTPAECPEALADAVLAMKELPEKDRVAMGARGRTAALANHEYGALAKKLEQVLKP